MRRRPILLPFIALLAVVAFVAGSCSSDDSADKDSDKTTTTKKSDDDSEAGSSTVAPADFDAALSQAQKALEGAKDDPCKIMEAATTMSTTMSGATTPEQREQAARIALDAIRAMADSASPELSAEADKLRDAADAIEKEGEQANWSEEFMQQPKAIKDNEAYTEASSKITGELTQKCTPTSTTEAK